MTSNCFVIEALDAQEQGGGVEGENHLRPLALRMGNSLLSEPTSNASDLYGKHRLFATDFPYIRYSQEAP